MIVRQVAGAVPIDPHRIKFARDGCLAAPEPRALGAVLSRQIQALAGGGAAGEVALPAQQQRLRAAPDGREHVTPRRDQERRVEAERPGDRSAGGAAAGRRLVVADEGDGGEDA